MPNRILNVELDSRAYPIIIGTDVLGQVELVTPYLSSSRVVIVTNQTLAPLYLERFAGALRAANIDVTPIILPDGERFKTWETLNSIFDKMVAARCDRTTTIIALGGGVVGDMAGFAAATYQRGVSYIQIPTTLLAQVDSSVGGKTAINHPLGKNMIGAFYQPRLVLADLATLSSLPDRELSAGLAEVVKYGAIMDLDFFNWLEENMDALLDRDGTALAYAVEVSCRCKAEIVAADERESGKRALLNFGHTFGHAIEAGLGYGEWLHGEAVAAGMVLAATLSARMGKLPHADVTRLEKLLTRAGAPTKAPALGSDRYLELMGHDKKVQQGKLRLILLSALGDAYVTADFSHLHLMEVLDTISADNSSNDG